MCGQVHRLTKSVVGVHVMVLQADGGELAVATTCASMALADAGIELYDLVAACSVGYSGTQVRRASVTHLSFLRAGSKRLVQVNPLRVYGC